jgi:Flp pilus assembly protein TadG
VRTTPKSQPPRGILRALVRDTKANVLAMMAIFLIPLSALTGSAVDVGRLYLVKVRLQQACDAGALAGRKFMEDSNNNKLDPTAETQAKTFFASNFPSGLLGTPAFASTDKNYPFTPTKTADNQVAGTASMAVPMTIMKMFGSPSQTITVSCEARFDVADSDIMFVLDTTGSMACAAADTSGCTQGTGTYARPDGTGTGYYTVEKSNSKLSGLRNAVMKFYDSLAANVDPSTHIRYGFVTYTSTVNAGFALPTSAFVNNWGYQSRRIIGDYVKSATETVTMNVSQASCTSKATGRNPISFYTTNGTAQRVTSTWAATNSTCTVKTEVLTPMWRYEKVNYDVSAFVGGATVDDPTKVTNTTSKWQGCIEERETTPGVTSFNIASLPKDLDPDLMPTDDASKWRPMWPDVIYYRNTLGYRDYEGNSTNPYGDSTNDGRLENYTNLLIPDTMKSGFTSCGKPVKRLGEMTRAEVSSYVNAVDFKPQGGTYHDVGMIWGTRMIAPAGIFASDTAPWPGRNPPNRYIVFMTDGDMAPNGSLYGLYGIETFDQRVSGGSGDLTNYHNKRFVAECAAAKARGIKVYVVAFGQTLTTELTACASTPQDAFYADDPTKLDAAFETIAKQVAMLRVSK